MFGAVMGARLSNGMFSRPVFAFGKAPNGGGPLVCSVFSAFRGRCNMGYHTLRVVGKGDWGRRGHIIRFGGSARLSR